MPSGKCLVLASASPRRLQLLRQIGLSDVTVDPADVDERVRRKELPRDLARRLARTKAETVTARHPDAFVLGADTVVAVGRRILPKPETVDAARACLDLLSGRRHRVFGGVAVATAGGRTVARLVETAVLFKRLEQSETDAYLASEEWLGKAGGYAIQGRAAMFVRGIVGSYTNVVGLPLFETAQLLKGLGFRW